MTPRDKLPGIHALRTVAALTVFLLHVINMTANWVEPVRDVTHHLHYGVPLFFALSAFSLMYSTLPYLGTPGWKSRFYLKRYFRIAPLFYLMLVIDVVLVSTMELHRILPQRPWPEPSNVFLNLVFFFELIPGIGRSLVFVGWSVGVEMAFYLLFPLIILSVRGIWSAIAFVVIATIIGELARPFLDQFPRSFTRSLAHHHLLTNLSYFAYGVLAFWVYRALRTTSLAAAKSLSPAVLGFHALCFAVSAALIVTLLQFDDSMLKSLPAERIAAWGILFAILCVWFTTRHLKVLSWAPFQYLGERSYSLYLLHLPVLALLAPFTAWVFAALRPLIGDWAVLFAIAATYAPIVLLSAITYRLVERPGMDLGKRIERRVGVASGPLTAQTTGAKE